MYRKVTAVIMVLVVAAGLLFAGQGLNNIDKWYYYDGDYDTLSAMGLEEPQTLAEKFSYAFGIYLYSNVGEEAMTYFSLYQAYYYPELDSYFGYMGMYDYSMGYSIYTVDELNQFLTDYPADYEARMNAKAEENLKIAEEFMTQNATNEGVQTTASGLQYKVITQGTGPRAQETDSVELDYELTLLDGEILDSSYQRGEHATFPLSSVIEGFREGVMLMPMGSHYIFYIHPDLGYGAQVMGQVGPYAVLIFEVETYSIE